MADGLFDNVYNPDVLSCLANLSNDEVFTPPEVVNQMLDMLPQELFRNPDTTFLDPACKTGVFLREIAKRLIEGLEPQFPDLQERIDHIFHKQLFGIAITELTSLLSRRGVYCSKYPNSEFSVSQFDDAQGNIRFKRTNHKWGKTLIGTDGKPRTNCIFCGGSKEQYERGDALETHAYEWIHTVIPQEIFHMRFDVIISNPPYQLETGGSGKQAKPIYNLFVEQAKKLNPRYMTMIIPSRWFAGGMGLDSFRAGMLKDGRIRYITDYPNAKECFSGVSISGGICYFLWDRDNKGDCRFTNIIDGKETTMERPLNEFPTLVRYNQAISIIHKVNALKERCVSEMFSAISPFSLSTKERGTTTAKSPSDLRLYSSNGVGYISKDSVTKGTEYINVYKVMVSQTSAEHAGEPSRDGRFRVLTSSMQVLNPGEICTHSYLIFGPFKNENEADNALQYLKTKFVRFLVLQSMTSIHLTKGTFSFVPLQDFSESWDDKVLYKKYGISTEEIEFIDAIIKPFDGEE